jgi:DNA polymerase III subunit epsilon
VSAAIVTDIPGNDPAVSDWLLKCPVPIPLDAVAVHGLNNEHCDKSGQDAATGIAQIIDALSKVKFPIVLVNCAYDFSILVCEAQRYGLDATAVIDKLRILDTLVCDRMLDPYRPGRRTLTAVSAAYGIAIKGAHTASGDVLCAIRLARAIGAKYPDFGRADLGGLQKVQRESYQSWASEFRDYRRSDDEPEFDLNTDWPYQSQMPL